MKTSDRVGQYKTFDFNMLRLSLCNTIGFFFLFPFFFLKKYQEEFPDVPIGYSGHEKGIYITVAAVAMGAKVVERHVTLDKTWKGNDHEASLEPSELAELVQAIRLVETAMGSPVKQMLPCEKTCHDKVSLSHLT